MKNHLILLCILIACVTCSCTSERTTFETAGFKLGLDGKGFVVSLLDRSSSMEYFPKGEKAPLLALNQDTSYLQPMSAEYDEAAQKITLNYANGSIATIKVDNKTDYLRFELVSVEPRNGIEAIVWGPYPTTIDEKIGETICVVRDSLFAIGMQALNINTVEGLPYGDDAGGCFIDPLPGQQVPDSIRSMIGKKVEVNVNVTGDMPDYVRMYRGTAAVKKDFGSELRLFSRDHRKPRIIPIRSGSADYKQYVEPIDVDFAGSAIALFGCPAEKALDIIEKIELGEGLPHPELDGFWIKRSTVPGQAYLLNEGDPSKSMQYAKECGFKLIHLGDFFQSWGHFGLKTGRFPKGAEDIRKATDAARQEGIFLGVHTLTMFTTTNDPYVSPVPSDSLCKTGSTVITKDLGKEDKEIYIQDPQFFRLLGSTHTVKIGKELINFQKVSDQEPWRLLDCRRGQFGTAPAAYAAGTTIDKLINNDYSGFYPDINLQDAYARRLAEVCNETGIDLMDFDGYGGGSPTGHGDYGAARFIDLWYRSLDRYRLTCGAGTFHYYWHIYAFMNWGEPWYNALRESQVNYRVENQRYFDRNLMPGMLGWFTLNPEFRPEEVEWIQARSAGFNAGYLLRVDESIERNGFRDELFELIREWQKARNEKVFSAEQLKRLQNPKNEFHLVKVSESQWDLYPVQLFRKGVHKYRTAQIGETVISKYSFVNPYGSQDAKFYITAVPVDGNQSASVSNLKITVNNYQSLIINEPVKAGDRLMCDGKSVYLCDPYWKIVKSIPVDNMLSLQEGENKVEFSCDFSGDKAPVLQFEFKAVGSSERVGK